MTEGFIRDDEIRECIENLEKDKKLTMVLDCCHSGTGCDLKYKTYRENKQFILKEDTPGNDTNANIIALSGCKDSQTSADAFEKGEYQGALTCAFLQVLKRGHVKNLNLTYDTLLKKIRKVLKRKGYDQIPQLTSGQNINLQDQFIM